MNKNGFMKWLMFASFCVLIIGGFNYLLMGLVEFDLFAEVFGGTDSIASRVIYSIFGFAALILATNIIYKSFYSQNQNKKTTKTAA